VRATTAAVIVVGAVETVGTVKTVEETVGTAETVETVIVVGATRVETVRREGAARATEGGRIGKSLCCSPGTIHRCPLVRCFRSRRS